MGRIKNEDLYILDQTVSGNDRLIGSDGDDLKKTKNFSVDDLLLYLQNNNPNAFKLNTLNTAPTNASDTGTIGETRIDSDFIYVCIASNTWKRVAIATW